ncbi:MAG: hypothetical protein AB8F78_09500 [Saprospiraceae bacterium]
MPLSYFKYIAVVLVFFCVQQVGAQDLRAVALDHGGKGNYLLWLPSDYKTLRHGADYGYTIRRKPVEVIATGERVDGYPEVIATIPPQDSAQWSGLSAIDDAHLLLYGAVYDGEAEMTFAGQPTLVELGERNDEQASRGLLAIMALGTNFELAREFGVGYIDSQRSQDTAYSYFVSSNAPTVAERIRVSVSPRSKSELHSWLEPRGIEVDESTARVFFGYKLERLPFAAYWLKRKMKGSNEDFKNVRELPSIPIASADGSQYVMVDSFPDCEKQYLYRVYTQGPFGVLEDKIEYNESVGCLKPITTVTPEISKMVSHINEYAATITVALPEALADLVSEIHIEQSIFDDTAFETVASGSPSGPRTDFEVGKLPPEVYFRVRIKTKEDGVFRSITYFHQPLDNIPPSPVSSIEAEWRGRGHLKLTWSSNSEPDFLGYRVFRANSCNGTYQELTSSILKEPRLDTFINLEGTLNRDIYFAVVPTDVRYNQDPEKHCFKFKRPDIMPPHAAEVIRTSDVPSGFGIIINNSISEDASHYRLLRRQISGGASTRFERISTTEHDWRANQGRQLILDTSTVAGVSYRYKVLSFDSTGNASSSKVFQAIGNGKRPGPSVAPLIDNVRLDSRADEAYVSFSYRDTTDLQGFEVYRSVNGQPLALYETITRAQLNAVGPGRQPRVPLSTHVRMPGPNVFSMLIANGVSSWIYLDADASCTDASAPGTPNNSNPSFGYAIIAIHTGWTSPQSSTVTSNCP